jgi:hypothetical protein
MTKKIFLTTLALSGLFISGIAGLVVTTNAQNSNISSNNISFEQRQVDRQAIKEALEKGDYNTWKSEVAKTPRGEEMLKAVDTEDDFKKLLEAHNKNQEAQDIKESLGLPTKNSMMESQKLVQEALEKGDYNTWKSEVAKTPRGEEMLKAVDTEDDFKKLMEAHNARKNGDIETFKTITKDLRINMGEKMMKGGRAGKMMKGSL